MIIGLVLVIVLGTMGGARWRSAAAAGADGRYRCRWPVPGDAAGEPKAGAKAGRLGGRRGGGFGTVLFWFLNAGEVYTTFAVSGYRRLRLRVWGAPAYLAFTSVSLSYAIGYWLMPRIWRAGRAARA